MKASIKFRDDDRPLMRAKVPIGVLGLPFQSGLSAAGDPRELRFDFSTAFASGPGLRLSYRPNEPGLPFALSVRAGLGALGSPARAPFSLAAEFNLLSASSGNPAFFLMLKPRLGDFSLSHTLRSSSTAPATPPRTAGEVTGGGGHEQGLELSNRAFSFSGNGLAADVAAAGRSGGLGALLSGMRLTTRSVLPLWGRANLRFNWGLRAPPELQAALADERKDARPPLCRMPLLVMNKISIEQSPRADADKKSSAATVSFSSSALPVAATDSPDGGGGGEALSLMRRQLEALHAECGMLRRAVDDLRAEIGSARAVPAAAEPRRSPAPPQPHHASHPTKTDRRGSGREPAAENAAKLASDEVGEELRKALEARRK